MGRPTGVESGVPGWRAIPGRARQGFGRSSLRTSAATRGSPPSTGTRRPPDSRAGSPRSSPRGSKRGAASSSSCAATRRSPRSVGPPGAAGGGRAPGGVRRRSRRRPAAPPRVGIGLDAGEAVPLGDGFRGAALNQAARLCAAAGRGRGPRDRRPRAPRRPGRRARVRGAGANGVQGDRRRRRGHPGAHRRRGRRQPLRPTGPRPTGHTDRRRILRDPAAAAVARARPHRPAHRARPRAALASLALAACPSWQRPHRRRLGPAGDRQDAAGSGARNGGTCGRRHRPLRPGWARPGPGPAARARGSPALTVVDDLDAGGPELARATSALAAELAGRAHLLLVIHRLEAPPPLQALAATLAPEERRRTVGPLDGAAVRAITGLYAGRAADDAPLGEIIAESDGVPAAVHRVASRWARTAATRRLGLSAGRTSTERHELRAAEDALVDDLADLEHVRDLALLYVERDDGDGPVQPRTVCPYKGLAAFDAADADYFFGRDRLVAELVAKSVGARFVGLVGDFGSGKSSALRAGLLPALAAGVLPGSDHWPQVVIRPGETPLAETARALAGRSPMPVCRRPTLPLRSTARSLGSRPAIASSSSSTSSRRSSTRPATRRNGARSSTCSPRSAPA